MKRKITKAKAQEKPELEQEHEVISIEEKSVDILSDAEEDAADQLKTIIDSSEGEASSDDDVEKENPSIETTDSLPTPPPSIAKRATRSKKDASTRGVIYLGRVPHGFYEEQMKSYFSQFGIVTRLRLSRNKKTGRSKHFAFIEFKSADVAQIVSETMNGYLMSGRLLKCKLVPAEKIHPSLWKGANQKFRVMDWRKKSRQEYNKVKSSEEYAKSVEKLQKKEEKYRAKLAKMGIDYSYDGVTEKLVAAQETK